MSRKGNCYDNATMESFWSTLKRERVYRGLFQTRAQTRTQIFDYIEFFIIASAPTVRLTTIRQLTSKP